MATQSLSQILDSKPAGQVRRRWQEAFRQRMHDLSLDTWRCVGVDIGKYEHVGVVTDGWGELLVNPVRFSIRQADVNQFLAQIDLTSEGASCPLVAELVEGVNGQWSTGYQRPATSHQPLCIGREAVSTGCLFCVSSPDKEAGDGETTRLWVITEADRSVTAVLLPEEY